ncbi:conserved hypothetical protein [Gammaproteobacteria bacterium]
MSNEAYDAIAEEIKEQYYKQTDREAQRGRSNPQLDAAVMKAADICREMECDPAIYVAAQLAYTSVRTEKGEQFFPNMLASKSARDNVNQYRSIVHRGNTWQGIWATQKRYLAQAVTGDRTVEEILLNHNIDFDAWFRCLISKEPIPSVIKKYGYEASQQLKNPELLTFINNLKFMEGIVLDTSRIPVYWV